MLVHVERRDRHAEACPHAVVVDAAGHDIDQYFVLPDRPGRQHFELHRGLRRTVALLANGPGVHPRRHVAERRNFADLIKIVKILGHRWLQRIGHRDGRHARLQVAQTHHSLPHFMLHRNIEDASLRATRDRKAVHRTARLLTVRSG
jgi:hypothetical protein